MYPTPSSAPIRRLAFHVELATTSHDQPQSRNPIVPGARSIRSGWHRLLFAMFLLFFAMVAAAEPLTNAGVVEMVRMGLDQEIIKAKIAAGPNRFDTSTPALAEMQRQKVPAAVIAAMISAGATTSVANANAVAGQPAGAVGSESQFYYGSADNLLRIKAVRISSQLSRRKAWIPVYGVFADGEVFIFIDGAHAENSFAGSELQFKTTLDPLNLRLVKLAYHRKRDDRYIVFSGSYSEREIPFDTSQDADGMYVLRVSGNVDSGEYAFLYNPASTTGGFWSGFGGQQLSTTVGFDFAVR
ncbi:MAG: hypothetical protein OMOMHJEC_02446 [Xanthomonadales bacterium]|nr:hypothetical protein [Xanthomonadales bacterium]